MHSYTIKSISKLLQMKEASAKEIAQDYLKQIESINSKINAFITLDREITLKEAERADQLIESEQSTVLTGVPIAYKDLFCHEGWRSASSSKILDNFVSPYTASVVKNIEKVGMVTLGRTNMDEFAMGSTTESSYYGPTLNPWDITLTPGGSSGGSAAAVAARLVPVALGSDTGGSIRQPASHCGVVGLKPTYGLVSRFGMIAYASSFDQAGPIATTAEDCALLLNQMAKFDELDSTSYPRKQEDYTRSLEKSIQGMNIGLPREYFSQGLDHSVEKSIQEGIDLLKKLGANIKEVSLPRSDLAIPAYYVLASAEASTNLSRYDGVRFGYRTKDFDDLESFYANTRSEGFGSEVKRRIMIGTYVLSHGYYDAYYVKAQKLRRLISDDFESALKECDAILAPVAPTAAPKISSVVNDPVQMYLSDIFTVSVNLAGLPAISIPTKVNDDHLPVGFQLIGNYFEEAKILNIAHQIQLNSDWHQKIPKLI